MLCFIFEIAFIKRNRQPDPQARWGGFVSLALQKRLQPGRVLMAWINPWSGVWQIREDDSGHSLCDEEEAALCLSSISQLTLFLVSTFSYGYDGELVWAPSTLCWVLVTCPRGSLLGAAVIM